jgi:phage-related protein
VAIVGTAFVRLKVIGDTLANDIGKSVKQSVDASSADLDKAGEDVGKKVSDSTGKALGDGINEKMGPLADSIGDQIGRRMGENMNKSLRVKVVSAVTNSFESAKTEVQGFGEKFKPSIDKFTTDFKKQTEGGLKKALSGSLFAMLGTAITVLPSMVAFGGAVAGALVSTVITGLAALGPAVAGGALAAVGGLAAITISMGLLKAAMDVQSPAMEVFRGNLLNLKTAFAEPVAAGLATAAPALQQMSDQLFPALNLQLETLGFVAAGIIQDFADMATTSANVERLNTVLANNNTFVAGAGAGMVGFAQAALILLSHLGPVTDFLGQGIQDLGEWAARTMGAAEATGALDGFITRSFDALRYFVGILWDFGAGVVNVFKAAFGASGGMLTNLHDVAASFRAWTGDETNQTRMTAFFEKMRDIAGQVLDIFIPLGKAGLGALEDTDLTAVTQGLDGLKALGPPIAQMFNSIKDAAGPALMDTFLNLVQVITQLADSGVLSALTGAFSNLLAIISAVLAIPGVGQLLAFVAGLAVMMKTVMLVVNVLKLLWPAIQLIIGIIRVLAAVFGGIPLAIAAVVIALVWFLTQTETGRAILAAAWNAIKVAISAAIDGLVIAFNWLVEAFTTAWNAITSFLSGLGGWFAGVFATIGAAISTAWNAALAFISGPIGAIRDFIVSVFNGILGFIQMIFNAYLLVITTVFTAIWGFIQPILTAIGGFFVAVFNGIMAVVQGFVNVLYEIWIRVFPLLLLPIRIFYGVVILIWQELSAAVTAVVQVLWDWIQAAWTAIYDAVSATVQAISDFVIGVWNAIWGFLQPIIQAIWDFIVSAWNGMKDAVGAAIQAISDVVHSVWDAISGFINTVVGAIVDFVQGRWEIMRGNIETALNAIKGVVESIWNGISGFIGTVIGGISTAISTVWTGISTAISTAMGTAKSTIETVWGNIEGFIQGALDRIKGLINAVWGTIGDIGEGILDGLKTAANGMISTVNGVISGLNAAIGVANMLPGADIPTIPKIPLLAKGGTISPLGGGTLAMIAEAGRPERVEPLDSSGLSTRDRAIINLLADGSGGGSGGTDVRVYIGERELTEIIDVVVEDREDSLAGRVLTGTKG